MKRDNQVHQFLVSQYGRESEESRSMLYAMGCSSDACCQGRKPCPTPEACCMPVESVESSHPWIWLCYAGVFVATIALSALLA
jgi:hypothetical protein